MPQDLLDELAARYGLSDHDRTRLAAQLRAPVPVESSHTQPFDLTGLPDDTTALPGVLPIDRPAVLEDPSGRYQAMAVLGRGGMGEVHRVWDRVLERAVAMKIILPMRSGHSAAIARFEQEARLTAQLQHPGIVAVYDLGRLPDGRLYITMEEVRGEPLARVLLQDHSTQHLLRLLADSAETVAFAHSHGILHRDLKPSNIMVVGFDDIKIVDWGLAGRLSGRRSAAPGSRIARPPSATGYPGTPAYMAPELLAGDPPTAAADVYALGIILHQLLTGHLPFTEAGFSAHAQRVQQGRTAPPELPRTVPAPLAALCRDALSSDPAQRPAAAELAAMVKAWLNGAVQREAALALVAQADELLEELEDLEICAADIKAQGDAALKDVPRWAPIVEKVGGWRHLDEARRMRQDAWRQEIRYLSRLHEALVMSPGLAEAHDRLAAWHRSRHAKAEKLGRDEERIRAEMQLAAHDRGAHRRYREGAGTLTVLTEPAGARITLLRYEERDRILVSTPLESPGITPLIEHPMAMGSYLLILEHPDHEPVRYPVYIRRRGHWKGTRPGSTAPLPVPLPPRGALSAEEVYIPPGWFTRGSDETTNARHRDAVWVDGFVMQRFPVTVAEYHAFQAARGQALMAGEPDWPAMGMTWDDAWAYCRWMQEQTGLPWRLPGEWEWEKAARGVDGRPYPWGRYGDDALACTRHSHPDDIPSPAPVTAFPDDVSVYGVRGVGGGVQQWCGDDNIWGAPVRDGVALRADPDSTRPERLIRGGSWTHFCRYSRCAWRHFNYRTEAEEAVGLRLARSL